MLTNLTGASYLTQQHRIHRKEKDQVGGLITFLMPARFFSHAGHDTECTKFLWAFITCLQIKRDHADWTDQQAKEEHAKDSGFNGRHMALSNRGTAVLQEIFLSRFKEGKSDRVAQLCSSNDCENFFGRVRRLSEGKRLNLENGDLWKSMVLFAAASCGQEEGVKFELSEALGLVPNSVEKVSSAKKVWTETHRILTFLDLLVTFKLKKNGPQHAKLTRFT